MREHEKGRRRRMRGGERGCYTNMEETGGKGRARQRKQEGRREGGVKREGAVGEKEKEGEREERGGERQRKIEMCKQERNTTM